MNNKLKSYITLGFFGLISYLALANLQIGKFNFWVDNPGFLDIKSNFTKYLYVWDNNALGSFAFSVPASLLNCLYTKTIYSIVGLERGTYFVLYFLIFFTLISSYSLLRKLSLDRVKSTFIALVFVFNPIFLHSLFATGTTTLIISYISVILSVAYAHDYFENSNISRLAKLIFSSILVSHPFIFVFLFATLIYMFIVNKRYKTALFLGISLLLTNFYWILPFLTVFYFKGGHLVGSYTLSMVDSLAELGRFQYSFLFLGWTYGFLKMFYSHYYVIYIEMFLIWIALIYAIFLEKSKPTVTRYYWLYVLLLLMFSSGPRGVLGSLYRFSLNNFSWFALFRSYQNVFFVLIVFVFYLFILTFKKNTKFLKVIQHVSIFFVVFFVLFQNSSFTNRSSDIPKEYFEVKDLVDTDKDISRVLLLPLSKYDIYVWDNPNSDKYFLQTFFNKNGLVYYRPTIDSPTLKKLYVKIYSGEDYTNDLYRLGIKYILSRKDLTKDDEGYFKPLHQTIPGKLLLSTDNIDLYSLESYSPIIFGDNASFSRQSPISYRVTLKGLNENRKTISFLESFQSGWTMYLNKYDSTKGCNDQQYFSQENTIECFSQDNNSVKDWLGFKELNTNHAVSSDGYSNVWMLGSEDIEHNYSGEYYKKNSDGTIDINLTLYFKPQFYFYLGLIISGATLLSSIIYLGYDFVNRRKKKTKKPEKLYEHY